MNAIDRLLNSTIIQYIAFSALTRVRVWLSGVNREKSGQGNAKGLFFLLEKEKGVIVK